MADLRKVRDPHKIVLVGDVGVGKTTLVLHIGTGKWHDTQPTAGIDFVHKVVDTGRKQAGKVEVTTFTTMMAYKLITIVLVLMWLCAYIYM